MYSTVILLYIKYKYFFFSKCTGISTKKVTTTTSTRCVDRDGKKYRATTIGHKSKATSNEKKHQALKDQVGLSVCVNDV